MEVLSLSQYLEKAGYLAAQPYPPELILLTLWGVLPLIL